MAFKMKGNPFPKKGNGAFKQDISKEMDLAYDKYLKDQDVTLEQNWKNFKDSIANVEQPFIDELDSLTQQYKDGSVSYEKYVEGFDLLKKLREKHQSEASNLPDSSDKDFAIYQATEDSLKTEADKVIDLLNAGKISKDDAIARLGERFTLTDK
tara:strand:- start:58 stop:519 length:462 start_codon:yes stop_codon:yes gene_type:complete